MAIPDAAAGAVAVDVLAGAVAGVLLALGTLLRSPLRLTAGVGACAVVVCAAAAVAAGVGVAAFFAARFERFFAGEAEALASGDVVADADGEGDGSAATALASGAYEARAAIQITRTVV